VFIFHIRIRIRHPANTAQKKEKTKQRTRSCVSTVQRKASIGSMPYDVASTSSFADTGAIAYGVSFFVCLDVRISFSITIPTISLWSIPFLSKFFNNEW
jgi:hypothetical protein